MPDSHFTPLDPDAPHAHLKKITQPRQIVTQGNDAAIATFNP